MVINVLAHSDFPCRLLSEEHTKLLAMSSTRKLVSKVKALLPTTFLSGENVALVERSHASSPIPAYSVGINANPKVSDATPASCS